MSSNRWLATGNYFTSYREEQRIFFTSLDRTAMCLLILCLFLWPFFIEVDNKYMLVIDNILVAVIAVMGLNLVTGFAGLISIGHAAFVGIGAYTIASFARVLGDSHVLLTHAWPLMILIAGFMGAVFGAIVGLPALRLKHLYLAIATLSFQMIFQWTINFMNFFNQGQTISVGRVVWLTGEVSRSEHYLFWYYAILVVIVLCGFAVRNLLRTRYGRCLVAVRDNDRAADAMGMHPGFTKVYAFALAGFLAGVAGAFTCVSVPRGRDRVLYLASLHQLSGHGDCRRSRNAARLIFGAGGDKDARSSGGTSFRMGEYSFDVCRESGHGPEAFELWTCYRAVSDV